MHIYLWSVSLRTAGHRLIYCYACSGYHDGQICGLVLAPMVEINVHCRQLSCSDNRTHIISEEALVPCAAVWLVGGRRVTRECLTTCAVSKLFAFWELISEGKCEWLASYLRPDLAQSVLRPVANEHSLAVSLLYPPSWLLPLPSPSPLHAVLCRYLATTGNINLKSAQCACCTFYARGHNTFCSATTQLLFECRITRLWPFVQVERNMWRLITCALALLCVVVATTRDANDAKGMERL